MGLIYLCVKELGMTWNTSEMPQCLGIFRWRGHWSLPSCLFQVCDGPRILGWKGRLMVSVGLLWCWLWCLFYCRWWYWLDCFLRIRSFISISYGSCYSLLIPLVSICFVVLTLGFGIGFSFFNSHCVMKWNMNWMTFSKCIMTTNFKMFKVFLKIVICCFLITLTILRVCMFLHCHVWRSSLAEQWHEFLSHLPGFQQLLKTSLVFTQICTIGKDQFRGICKKKKKLKLDKRENYARNGRISSLPSCIFLLAPMC